MSGGIEQSRTLQLNSGQAVIRMASKAAQIWQSLSSIEYSENKIIMQFGLLENEVEPGVSDPAIS